MAKKLKSFNFRSSGSLSVYPWDKWLDGSVWELHQGEDFTVSSGSMQSMVHARAAKMGLKARTAMTAPDTIVVQSYSN